MPFAAVPPVVRLYSFAWPWPCRLAYFRSGPWSPGSREWEAVRPEARTKYGLPEQQESRGDFVMGMEDFITAFTHMLLLHLPPTFTINPLAATRLWTMHRQWGKWANDGKGGWLRPSSVASRCSLRPSTWRRRIHCAARWLYFAVQQLPCPIVFQGSQAYYLSQHYAEG